MVTGCLKMEAVCLTGSDVFKSGLPLKNIKGGGEKRDTKKERRELFHRAADYNTTRQRNKHLIHAADVSAERQ